MQDEAYLINFSFEDDHWWFVGRRRIVLDRIKLIFPTGVSSKSALDFGCGTGKMLQCMRSFERVAGIDASDTSLDYCRRRGLTNVMKDEVFFRENPAARFDLVTMLDVLEHIPDEQSVLQKIHGLLDEDGALLITVPAYDFLWGDEDILSNHVRRYSRKRLEEVVDAAGFTVTFASHFNFFLLPVISAVLLAKRVFSRGKPPTSNVKPVPRVFNQCLTMILTFESWLLRRIKLPMGASLILYAKKKAALHQ